MKLANPLHYPLAILVGGIVLVVSTRLLGAPKLVMLPVAAATMVAGAAVLKSREPDPEKLAKQRLQQELDTVRANAAALATKAESLRQEADRLLTSGTFQLELLTTVQYACDRAVELPAKLDELSRRLQGGESLLSQEELQRQLTEVQAKMRSSSGVARQHLSRLQESLQRNIQLARAGQDARTAQIASLEIQLQDAAGVLQRLQNKLRTSNLEDSGEIQELRSLSDELSSFQENVDILVSR